MKNCEPAVSGSRVQLRLRQPSEAMRACRQTLALEPESVEAQQCLERAHLQRGEITDALAAANAAATRRGGPLPAILNSATAPQERLLALWRWRVQQLDAASTRRYVNPYTIAMHYVVLGDRDRALERLEEAYHTRVAMMVLLRTDPIFEPLRDESRFRQLLDRIR